MRIGAVFAMVLLAQPALADCELPEPGAAAAEWRLVEDADTVFGWAAERGGIRIPLTLDAPVVPVILDWEEPGQGIGILHYFSGDPGTSSLTTLTRGAVVDLSAGSLLGDPYLTVDCAPADWVFHADRIEASDDYGTTVIPLPAR